MGVTTIQQSPFQENLVAIGRFEQHFISFLNEECSYDEYLTLWDTRLLKNPLMKLGLGGGVWRLKWHPTSPKYIAVCLMRAGFGVVEIEEGVWKGDHLFDKYTYIFKKKQKNY